jgi:hypothetical protein
LLDGKGSRLEGEAAGGDGPVKEQRRRQRDINSSNRVHREARGRSERCVRFPECDGTGQRAWTCPDRVSVIAALDNPLTVFVANNLAHVVTPDDDRANGWSTGV